MDDWQWRVRIDTDTDPAATLGAGILIDSQRVLTCAHLVAGRSAVQVSFPGGSEGVPAAVVRVTGWTRLGDQGDLALLRLAAPTSVPSARFAVPEGTYWTGELRAHGFRRHFEQTGSYVTVRTSADMTLAREWWQLDVNQDRPERLAPGFSGAAVYLADTGEVIGMVTDADLGNNGRMGRMLPLSALRRHWEDLDDLLPLSWLTPAQRRELRDIVRNATPAAQQAYAEAFPCPGPAPQFRSAWDAIRYVAEERFEPAGLATFLAKLAHRLPHRPAGWQPGAGRPWVLRSLVRRQKADQSRHPSSSGWNGAPMAIVTN